MKKRKFFLKILMIYVIIVFVYTSIVASLTFYKNNQINKLELDNQLKIVFKTQKDSIDTKLAIAFNLVNQLEISNEMEKYVGDRDNNAYNVITIYQTLRRIQMAFTDLRYKDLGIMLAFSKVSDDRVISYNNVLGISDYYKDMGFSETDQQQIKDYYNSTQNGYLIFKTQSKTVDKTTRQRTMLVKKDYIGRSAGNRSILVFLSFYDDMLIPELVSDSPEALAIIMNEKVVCLKSTIDRSNIEKFLSIEMLQKLHMGSSEIQQLINNGFKINTMRSDIFNWSYLHISPVNVAGDKTKRVLYVSIQVFVLMSLAGVAVTFLLAKGLYKPIENILKVFRSSVQKEEKDEFTFIMQEAVEIKNTNENLKEIIKNNRIPLRTKFLRDLLYGHVSNTVVQQQISQFGLEYLENGFTVVVLEIDNSKDLDVNFSHDTVQEIKTQTMQFFLEQVRRSVRCEMLELEYKRFALFIGETEALKISKVLRATIQQVHLDFDLEIIAALGDPVYSVEEIEKSFYDTLDILNCNFFERGVPIITSEARKQMMNESYYYPMDVERDLINYVIRGKRENVMMVLGHILDKNFKERKLSKQSVSQFLFALVATINRILQIINKNPEDFFEEGVILYIEMKMFKNEKDLQEKTRMVFEKIITHIEAEESKHDNEITNQLMAYIHENYNRDVSLNDMAEHFNLSRGYFCTVFKNATGENFKDYLNIYRVKMAKQIMDTQKDIKIKELSERVGCNNTNTFIRIFNKYEGMSPGQYSKERE